MRDLLRLAGLCVTLAAIAMGGCGPPAPGGDPLAPPELEQFARSLDRAAPPTGLRGSGSGSLSGADRRTFFTFAALTDGEGWLRADLRPSSPAAPSGFTAQLEIDGACARLYFPSTHTMVSDCLEDPPVDDLAPLLLGRIDGGVVRRLRAPRLLVGEDTMQLTGERDGVHLELTLDAETLRLRRVEAEGPDEVWVTAEYEGHGWKESLPLPRVTVVRYGRSGRTHGRLRLEFDRLRRADDVDPTTHEIFVVPGSRELSWGDLTLWR